MNSRSLFLKMKKKKKKKSTKPGGEFCSTRWYEQVDYELANQRFIKSAIIHDYCNPDIMLYLPNKYAESTYEI